VDVPVIQSPDKIYQDLKECLLEVKMFEEYGITDIFFSVNN